MIKTQKSEHTAGDLKRSSKKKKEKTLSSKLRMKEKKQGSGGGKKDWYLFNWFVTELKFN